MLESTGKKIANFIYSMKIGDSFANGNWDDESFAYRLLVDFVLLDIFYGKSLLLTSISMMFFSYFDNNFFFAAVCDL